MTTTENLGIEGTPLSASTVCRICGRSLTDPESIKKGMGPVCERRYRLKGVMQESLDSVPGEHRVYMGELPASEPIDWDAPLDLVKVAARIEDKKPLCICGQPLSGRDLRYYGPHEGGYMILGHDQPQWVYIHHNCPGLRSGYDVALWKIRRELD